MTSTLFASTRELLHKAQRVKYAVGHFNVNNLEIVQGVVAAAQRLKSPVVLATSEGAIGYAGMKYLYAIAQIAAQESKIPIALHLDHGGDMNVVRSAIRLGYSSVMIDASHEEFEKNVTLDRKSTRLNSSHISISYSLFFFLNDTAPTEIYPLPLHDALPIWLGVRFVWGIRR